MTPLYEQAGVYRIIHIPSGSIYVGSSHSLGRRIAAHRRDLRRQRHRNWNLQNLWDQSQESDWLFEYAISTSRGALLIEEEQFLIDEVDKKLLLNIKPFAASNKDAVDTPEIRARKSAAQQRRRLWESAMGIKRSHTLESRERMSASRRGVIPNLSPEGRARVSAAWKGKKRPQSTRDKMSASMKALLAANPRIQSPASNEKRRLALLGRPRDEETRNKIRERMKLVWAARKSQS